MASGDGGVRVGGELRGERRDKVTKSLDLIKGKMGVSFAVFLVIGFCFFAMQLMFEILVVRVLVIGVCFFAMQLMFEILVVRGERGIGDRIGYEIVSLIRLSILMLFGLIAQTIIYLVCKSYHHQNIDKSLLADHLGEYVPLKAKDMQFEHSGLVSYLMLASIVYRRVICGFLILLC